MYYNYLLVKKRPPWRKHCLVIDTEECLMDAAVAQRRLNVRVGKEYSKIGRTFCFVECSVRNRDWDDFEAAMEDLKGKMAVFGHADYEDFCRKAERNFSEYTNGAYAAK